VLAKDFWIISIPSIYNLVRQSLSRELPVWRKTCSTVIGRPAGGLTKVRGAAVRVSCHAKGAQWRLTVSAPVRSFNRGEKRLVDRTLNSLRKTSACHFRRIKPKNLLRESDQWREDWVMTPAVRHELLPYSLVNFNKKNTNCPSF
jgi:hypothetical protein